MPSKRLTIEISDELQSKLQSIMPPNTLPTRKELVTKLLEMVLEGVEEHGQVFLFDILEGRVFLDKDSGFTFTWEDVDASRKSALERGEIEEIETPFGALTIRKHKLFEKERQPNGQED